MKLTKRHLILLLVIIYFTFIGGTFYSQLNFGLRLANQVIVTLILGGWLLARLWQKQGLPATRLDLPLAAYLLVNLISAAAGVLPRYSLEMMWFTVTHALAFYLLVDLLRRGWAGRLAWAFYMAAAVVCLVGLAEFAAWYAGAAVVGGSGLGWAQIGGWRQPWPPQLYRLNITLNGATPLAAYLALLTPPALGLILTLPRRSDDRQALWGWLGLALLVQMLTFSRAGILALGVSLALLAVGWRLARVRGEQMTAAWIGLIRRPVVLLGAVLAGGAGLFWLQHSFANRAHSTNFRFLLWDAAGQIFWQYPFTGAGPASFGRALLQLNQANLPRQQIATAHSIYFNTAAELGLPGLLAGAGLVLALAAAWLRRWQQAAAPAKKIRLAAVGAALAGLLAQTVVDTYPATPNMLVMLALAAYVAAPPAPSTRRPYTAAAALAVLLLYMGWFVHLGRADWHFGRSFRLEAAGNLTDAAAQAAQARALDPALPLRAFRVGLLQARLAHQTGEPAALAAALESYRAGLAAEAIHGLESANMAGVLWQAGQRAQAIAAMQQAIAAEPDPLYKVNLGYFYEQAGAWSEAVAAYADALARAPSLAASGFWQADTVRAGHWPDIAAAALGRVAGGDEAARLWQVNLAAAQADWPAVLALAEPFAADNALLRQAAARARLEQGQPEQAAAALNFPPESGPDYWLWGRVKLAQHDPAAAETRLKTAAFMGITDAWTDLGRLYEQQGQLVEAEAAYGRGFAPRGSSENIAVNIYDRRGGSDLAPQLVRLGVGPEQAQAWLALARLYEQRRQTGQARQIYTRLLAEDPFLSVASERLAALAP